MIVRIWEVKRVACYVMLRLKLLHKAVASVASMVAIPLIIAKLFWT